ncbi:type IV secretion system protein [Klebsiella quasipneumoniae]|uniref:type IV secretion system protein n=1 Tax=Klebsiella quasipneumoniae TaxID=1463165 RepID=UPI001C987E7C|nr:type IV secretion system protein [Klebsiella quasipneumoniae]MBY5246587.1 type IV secretion system protein [Klebsiella quasipneumoniae]
MADLDFSGVGTALDSLMSKLTASIISKASGFNEKLLAATSAFFAAATVVYFIYKAIQMIYSDQHHDPMTFLKDIAIFAALSAFTYGGSLYTQDIAQFVMYAGDDLASAAVGSDSTSALTAMLNQSLKSLMTQYNNISFSITSIPSFLLQVLVLLCALAAVIVFVAECFFYLIIAKFMAGLCVSVGGLFICALAFPPTRNMFSSWVAMSVNYILLVLLMTLGLSLIVGIITSNVSTMATFSDCIIALVTLLIAGKIVHQIPTLAGGLSNGIQLSTVRAGEVMSKSNPAIGLAQNTGKGMLAAGRGGMAVASKVMSHIKGGIGKA